MFGGPIDPPAKPKPKPRGGDPQFQDILNPSIHPRRYAHYGREPNTNYKARLLHYKQRSTELEQAAIEREAKRIADECYKMKSQKNVDKKRFHKEIRSRVNRKLEEYDKELDKKRERLRELLAKDEREFYRETADNLQKGRDLKYEEMKEKVKKLEAEKEAKRLKIVEQKRIQQYADRCQELRPVLAKKHLIESKVVQLQQMRENEARREAEREWDRMWEDTMNRDIRTKMDREEQEGINEHRKLEETKEYLEMQIKGKELAKMEELRILEEDRLEMEKLAEQLRREQIEGLEAKRKQKIKMAEELQEQIRFQEKVIADRKMAEQKLNDAFVHLSQIEYQREQDKITDMTQIARREAAQYRQHLKELEQQRKDEDRELYELLEEHRKLIEKKQDEARCKMIEAKEKLMQDVLAGRAEQLAYKRQAAEQQLKMKEAENELCRLTYNTYKRLMEEDARLKLQAAKEYRNDLCKQIDYNNTLKEREMKELERKLELGKQDEEKYKKMVDDIISKEFELGERHPFRRHLEKYDCQCPKLNQKY